MDCAVHPGTAADGTCPVCGRACCAECLTSGADGQAVCVACADLADERARSLGSLVFALVGVGYLAALAIGYVVFRGRPFVGGIAAVVALALGRALQITLRLPPITGPSESLHVDVSREAR